MTGSKKKRYNMEAIETSKVLNFIAPLKRIDDGSQVRAEALQALNAMDFPTTRVEDWKYTRTTRITNKSYVQRQEEMDATPYFLEGDYHRIVFVNGFLDQKQTSILEDDAVSIKSIQEIDEEMYAEVMEDTDENVFSLINKAFSDAGCYITIAKNKKATYPIQIVNLTKGSGIISNIRHFFDAQSGSLSEIILTNHSVDSENSFQNVVIEGTVAANAKLLINKIQAEEKNVFHLSNEQFIQDGSSNFEINTITTGGLLVRNGLNVIVDGENCHTELNGVYLGKEKQHLDNHTFVDHLYGNCTSSETYKGVMDDKSTGVFNGKVVVRQDAQKIEAYQSNGNVLLSDFSTVNSKPELEIYADDVRCSHGSTTGQLDDEAVYYLKTRGISEQKAKELLVVAFIGEVLNKIDNTSLRAYIDELFLQEYGWEF